MIDGADIVFADQRRQRLAIAGIGEFERSGGP